VINGIAGPDPQSCRCPTPPSQPVLAQKPFQLFSIPQTANTILTATKSFSHKGVVATDQRLSEMGLVISMPANEGQSLVILNHPEQGPVDFPAAAGDRAVVCLIVK